MLHWGGSSALCGVYTGAKCKIIYTGAISAWYQQEWKMTKWGKDGEQQHTQTIQPRIVWICFDSFDAL